MSTSNQPVINTWATQPEHLRRMVDFIDRFTARVVETLQKFDTPGPRTIDGSTPRALRS